MSGPILENTCDFLQKKAKKTAKEKNVLKGQKWAKYLKI